MNGLNNAGIFPYSLNNLQVLSLEDGGTLPVSADVPLIRTLTSTNQELSLFESSADLIDFNTFNKSLRVKELFASTGSFNNIYATGANFLTLNATGINCNTLNATTSIFSNGSLNAPSANISCFGINAVGGLIQTTNGFTGPFITANSGTFQNVNTDTLTANTIVINTVNIPNLSFNTATGVNASITNINNTSFTGGFMNFNTGSFSGLTGGNLFVNNLTATNSIFSASSMNAPVANIQAFALTASGFVNAPSFSGALANFGSVIVNTGSFNNIQTQTLNSTGTITSNTSLRTTNGSAVFDFTDISSDGTKSIYNAGGANDGFSLRFDGTERLFLRQNGELLVSNINCSGAFTGAKIDTNFLTFTTATGGTLRSSVAIRNPQTLSFNKTDNTEIVRIEPAGVADVLSFFNPGGVLQTLYTTTSSGANVDNLNQLGTKDITNLGRVFNGDGSVSNPSYSFVNDTDTGFYRVGANNIALTLGNSQKVNFQTNLITLGSSSNNSVGQAINGDLQVGRTSFNNVALINLGFSGASFGVNPGRQGFITMDGTNMTISNTQANTGSTSHGSIFITPANNGTIRLLKQADGVLSNIGRNDGYAHQFANLQTGGLGMLTTLVNKPDSAYLFSSQGPGFNSAITMHGSLGQQMSNITCGRTNFPFTNNEFLTGRPWSPTGSTSLCMKVANQVSETNGFGCFGMFASGTTLTRNHTYISNSAVLGGISFHTNDTAVIPTTYPRYLIDVAGNHSFSVKTATGVFGITSEPFAVGIGESFTRTCGNGRFLPVARGNLNNTSYTGGAEFIARGTADSNNDHSAYTSNGFSADHKGFYRIQWNVNGSFATSADTLFIRVKVAGTTRNVCTAQFPTTGQLGNSTGYCLFNCNASDDIDLFFEPDTNRFDCANDGYFLIEYVG